MITALQNFFLKHNKWLFGSLLVVIIVTFVLTIGPQSFFGSGAQREQEDVYFYGYNLSNPADQRVLQINAELSATLHPELGIRQDNLINYAYLRAAALGLAARMGVPNPSDKEFEIYTKSITLFQDPQSGEFSAESYNNYINLLKQMRSFTEEQIGRVLREDYRISRVREALGGPSYALPFEHEMDFATTKTQFDIAMAKLDYASFEPELNPDEEELIAFFDQNPAEYLVPEKIKVTGLIFSADNYLDEVADPTDDQLNSFFTQNKHRYQPKAEGEEAAPEITLDTVKDTVVTDWKLEEAKDIAGQKAETFTLRIWQEKTERFSSSFESIAEEFAIRSVEIPPFAREAPPRMGNIPMQILNSMWIYSSGSRYFSDVGTNSNGAVVVVFDKLFEEFQPPFEDVVPSVTRNFLAQEKQRAFSEKGVSLNTQLTEALESGTDFQIAAEALGLKVQDIEPFDGSSIPTEVSSNQAWRQSRFLKQGSLSQMFISNTEGTFVYVQSKSEPEIDTASEEFLTFVDQREQLTNEAMGWARLQEMTSTALASIFTETEPVE